MKIRIFLDIPVPAVDFSQHAAISEAVGIRKIGFVCQINSCDLSRLSSVHAQPKTLVPTGENRPLRSPTPAMRSERVRSDDTTCAARPRNDSKLALTGKVSDRFALRRPKWIGGAIRSFEFSRIKTIEVAHEQLAVPNIYDS